MVTGIRASTADSGGLTGRLVCLFVCSVHGIPVVCGGRRLTKDGPYATRRQAEAFLFVRRKPTPPFAGCQGNLLFRGSRGLQTGRPVDHRPYSARHVGLKVESFGEQQTLCSPSTPNGRHIKVRKYSQGLRGWRNQRKYLRCGLSVQIPPRSA